MAFDMFLLGIASDCLLPDIQYIEQVIEVVEAEVTDVMAGSTILSMLFDTSPPSYRIQQEIVILTISMRKLMMRSDIWQYNQRLNNQRLNDDNDHYGLPSVLSVMQFGDCEPSDVLLRPGVVPGNWRWPNGYPTLPIARSYVIWHTAQREREHYVVIDTGSNIWCTTVQWTRAQFKEWLMRLLQTKYFKFILGYEDAEEENVENESGYDMILEVD